MKINFILSDSTKGVTTQALKEVIKKAEENLWENNIVIVPENKSIIIEKEILDLSKNGAFLNVFVYSFVRLLDRLGAVEKDKILSKQTCVILLRKIILDNEHKLECYKKSAKMVGFAEKIYETIAQFKSSGISVEELKLSLLTNKESLRAKLKDILLLYEEYEKALSGTFFDDCDRLALLSKFAKDNQFLKESNVFIIGFDNITYEMQTILRDVAKNSKEINFSCVYFNEKRKDKHIQTNELYEKFKHIADSLNYSYVPSFHLVNKIDDLKKIQYEIFSTEREKADSKGNVKIFEAKSQKQEIDFIANTILNEVSNGKRFKDIGILSTNLTETLELFEDCFKAYNIPYFANVSRDIDNHFAIRFIELAFEIYISHLSFEKVLQFLANPLYGCDDYEIFENYVLENGVNYLDFLNDVGDDFIENQFKFFSKYDIEDVDKKRKIEQNLLKIKTILTNFQDFYIKFEEKILNSKTVNDYINIINFIISYFDVYNKIKSVISFQKENNLKIQAEISNVILDKIEHFGNQLSNFLGNNILDVSEFLLIYKTGFSASKINLSPVSIDCVIIQENTDGFYNIKDLFISGAVEGLFPSKIYDSGIILDSELEETKNQIGKNIEPAVKDINRREKYRTYEALIEPTEKLFISYSLKNIRGKSNKPARIVIDLKELFNDDIKLKKINYSKHLSTEVLESRFVNSINRFLNDKTSLTNQDGVNFYYSQIFDKLDEEMISYIENSFKKLNFNISDPGELYFRKNESSASKYQTYFSCPYKFFAEYGLALKERKEAKITAIDVGTILHRVAELFAKKYINDKSFSEDNLAKIVRELLEIALIENKIRVEKNKSIVELLFDESLRLCKYLIYEQDNSGFKMQFLEYNFSNDKAIKLDLENGKEIDIIGKIDRIDSFGEYIRVIDYKTGDISTDLKTIYFGEKIQLPIYMQAVENIQNKKIAGIFYFPIHSKYSKSDKNILDNYKLEGFLLDDVDVVKNMDFTISEEKTKSNISPVWVKYDKKTGQISFNGKLTNRYTEKEFDELKMYVKKLCCNATMEILSGYNEPSPIASSQNDTPDSCEYCKLNGFCGLKKSRFKNGRNLTGKVDIGSFYCIDKDVKNG